MTRALLVGLALVTGGCGCDEGPVTQVVVTVEADPDVYARTTRVDWRVFGRARADERFAEDGAQLGSWPVGEGHEWPVRIVLTPLDGDATRLYRIEVTARAGEMYLAQAVVVSGYVEGRTLWLRVYIDSACLDVHPCEDESQTCVAGICVDARRPAEELSEWGTGRVDGGTVSPVCARAEQCDDGVACTLDECRSGACVHEARDDFCRVAPDGRCDPVRDCQYDVCDEATTCVAAPCQTAVCNGTECERTNHCTAGQTCCAGECEALGCDDGNPCTDDTCGASGCENVNNTRPCSDPLFCNGAEICSGGSCAGGTGDPCAATSGTCDEDRMACVGCSNDADCTPLNHTDWSASCSYVSTCDETGAESGTQWTYLCEIATSSCVASISTVTRTCPRDTDGLECGTPSTVADPTCTRTTGCSGTRNYYQSSPTCTGGTCEIVEDTTTAACDAGCPFGGPDGGTGDSGIRDGGADG